MSVDRKLNRVILWQRWSISFDIATVHVARTFSPTLLFFLFQYVDAFQFVVTTSVVVGHRKVRVLFLFLSAVFLGRRRIVLPMATTTTTAAAICWAGALFQR